MGYGSGANANNANNANALAIAASFANLQTWARFAAITSACGSGGSC